MSATTTTPHPIPWGTRVRSTVPGRWADRPGVIEYDPFGFRLRFDGSPVTTICIAGTEWADAVLAGLTVEEAQP